MCVMTAQMFSNDTVVASTNGTWLNDGLINAVLDALDNGPWAFDPKTAMTMAIATPIALIMLCLVIMICRGIPTTSRFSLCTSWKHMPRGTDPDHGIGEHQDELADVDSVDEQPFDPQRDDEMLDDGTGAGSVLFITR